MSGIMAQTPEENLRNRLTFQGMSEPHVITGLKAKAHEIHMRIAKLEDQIKVCRKDK